MSTNAKAIMAMAAWLAAFGILLFGGFRFDNWTEEFWKNVAGIGVLVAAAALTGVFSYQTAPRSR